MIETLIEVGRRFSARNDDDIADRMNYLYTPSLLLIFSVLISFKQFGGRPIECMFPTKFSSTWEQYAEMLCWSDDTYYVPPEESVANIELERRYAEGRRIAYYQWVPFFLLFQAVCFRFPSVLWSCVSISSGIRIQDIVKRAMDSNNIEEDKRQQNLDTLARYLSRAMNFQHQIVQRNMILYRIMRALRLTYSISFLSYMYLATKILYIGNTILQLYMMNKFMGTDKLHWYGLTVVVDILHGYPWKSTGYFPRITLCDFKVRTLAHDQVFTIQCVLIINMFNEKIFVLLSLWFALLLVSSTASFVYWLWAIFFPCIGRAYVMRNLELADEEKFISPEERKRARRFVNECLKQDGVFVLRMVGLHAGVLFNSELAIRLYKIHSDFDNFSFRSDSRDKEGRFGIEKTNLLAVSNLTPLDGNLPNPSAPPKPNFKSFDLKNPMTPSYREENNKKLKDGQKYQRHSIGAIVSVLEANNSTPSIQRKTDSVE